MMEEEVREERDRLHLQTSSFANNQDDARLANFAAAFNFATPVLDESEMPVLDDQGETVFKTGTLESFLSAIGDDTGPFATADDFLADRSAREATFALLGIDQTFAARRMADRVLSSDLNDPTSFANISKIERSSLFIMHAPVQIRISSFWTICLS